MSQIPRNRFGFQGPPTVTVTATRTTRIPGTNATRTESTTSMTEVNICPAANVPQAAETSRGIPRVSGMPTPRSISRLAQPVQPPSGIARPSQGIPIPGPSQARFTTPQSARGLRLPSQGPPQKPRQLPVPSGIPSRSIRPSSGLPRQVCPATPQIRNQHLGVPSEFTPDRLTPSPGSYAPKVERTLPALHSKLDKPTRPFGIGVNVPGVLKRDQRISPRDQLSAAVTPVSLEQQVKQRLSTKSSEQPRKKVSAKGKRVTTVEPEVIQTPAGPERVIQKAVFERRVERGGKGEKIVRNLAVSDFDDLQGAGQSVEIGMQQLDPQLAMKDAKEVVGVTSTISVTPSYMTISKKVMRSVTEPLDHGIMMEPATVAQLVREEKEDVDNTLKMIPPELNLAPGKYETKQRLQQLRLNSESMALLEDSIIRPEVTADEPLAEPTPEAMANMMHTVENGISPRAAPDQVFHTLFSENANEQYIKMSSVSPGPLQDVVIPTEDVPNAVHNEVISDTMDTLADKFSRIQDPQQVPYVDIFTKVMDDMAKSPGKGKNKPISFQPISDEKSLWVNAKLERLVNVVGAEPSDILSAIDIEELSKSGDLEKEMSNGVEFYIDTDAVQYMNRIQLRGTQLPSYFPGYMVAVPDFPGIVQIARSPDEVFATAWKSVQPKYFAEDSLSAMSF